MKNLIAFSLAECGAMGWPNEVVFVFHENDTIRFLYTSVEDSLTDYVPWLDKLRSGFRSATGMSERWNHVYLGMGNHLFLINNVYDLLKERFEGKEPPEIFHLWHDELCNVLGNHAISDEFSVFSCRPEKARNMSFFEIMHYVRKQNMCTEPGCTTCGCLPFRRFISTVGYDAMKEKIAAVTLTEIEEEDPELWYEPMRLIVYFFSDIGRMDCPLVRSYGELKDECLAAMERRRIENLQKQEEIHLAAVARKEEKRRAHEKRSQEARDRYYKEKAFTD